MEPDETPPAAPAGPPDERVLALWARAADARAHARMASHAAWGWGLFALACFGNAADHAAEGGWLWVTVALLTCLVAAFCAVKSVGVRRLREGLARTYDEQALIQTKMSPAVRVRRTAADGTDLPSEPW